MLTTTINTMTAKTTATDPGNGNWVRHALGLVVNIVDRSFFGKKKNKDDAAPLPCALRSSLPPSSASLLLLKNSNPLEQQRQQLGLPRQYGSQCKDRLQPFGS